MFKEDAVTTQLNYFANDLANGNYGEDELIKKYTERILLSIEHNCCDLNTVDEMLEQIHIGAINHNDGYGYWLDKDFQEVGMIFDGLAVPAKAVWADWYNK